MYKFILRFFIILFLSNSLSYASSGKDKITIQLSWFDQFQFAGYYMAKEKEFYKKAGLDVIIKPFEFGLDIPKDVSEKKIDFAVGRETLILDKSKGRDIVALYALFQSTPLVLLSKKDSGISQIEDFKNKSIMTTIDDASEVSLKAMIRSENVRLEDLNFVKHTHNINDLLDDKIDVISAYISKSPFVLENKNIAYNIFDPKDFGFDMYSDLLYTSNKLISEDIEKVIAFKEASLKGWAYAYENIEETVSIIFNKYNSQKLTKEELLYEGKELKKLSYFNNEELGNIKKEKLQRIFDLYNIMGLTQEQIDFDDFVLTDKNSGLIRLSAAQKEYLSNKKEITMCVIPNAMPYSNINGNKVEGVITDLIAILEEMLDVPFKLVKTDKWIDSLEFIRTGKCEILPSAQMTDSRKKYMNFTQSYTYISSVIITKNDIPFIDSLSSLSHVNIGVLKGFSLHESLVKKYPDINFVEVDSISSGLELVKDGKLYGHITSMGNAWHAIQNDFSSDLKISGKVDKKIGIRVAIQKDDILLYEVLNEAISKISKEEIDRINNKWIYIEQTKEFDYVLLLEILVIIFFVILALLFRQNFLKKMNNELNKKVEEKTEELKRINSTLEERIQKEVDKNLKKDRMLAEQSKMAAMGRMIENIAHQWRQPLSVISTGASGIKLKKQLNDLDDAFFYATMDSIISSSQYLSHTIDDFRFFFKPNNEKTKFSIDRVLEKTTSLLSSKFEHENIKIVNKLEKVEINGHETELIQIFMNILNNAKDALESSSQKDKYIFIKSKKLKNSVIIEFKDNAGGIKSKDIDKIFEPYFTTKHSSKGTGIGLYMCDQIISKYMNGRIEVKNKKFKYKNEEYKGALFTVIFESEE